MSVPDRSAATAFPYSGNPPLVRMLTDPKTGLVYVWRDGAWTAVCRVA